MNQANTCQQIFTFRRFEDLPWASISCVFVSLYNSLPQVFPGILEHASSYGWSRPSKRISPTRADIRITDFPVYGLITTARHFIKQLLNNWNVSRYNYHVRGASQVEKSPRSKWVTKFFTVVYDGACSPNVSVRMAWISFGALP